MVQRLRDTKERNGKRNFAIQRHQGFPKKKATATAWRISEDFAKRVSAKPRSAPCRLLRNWVCFYAKTCRSIARAYACALVSKTTARLTGKLKLVLLITLLLYFTILCVIILKISINLNKYLVEQIYICVLRTTQ